MGEIKRKPLVTIDDDGEEIVSFDINHTHSDIVRYLMEDLTKEEILFLVKEM